jgi:hypothetical protein
MPDIRVSKQNNKFKYFLPNDKTANRNKGMKIAMLACSRFLFLVSASSFFWFSISFCLNCSSKVKNRDLKSPNLPLEDSKARADE